MIIFGLSLWLWLFIGLFVTIGVFAYEQDNPVFSCAVVFFAFLGLQFLFGVPVWQSIVDNPLNVLLWLAGYFVIGSLYSLLWKWRNYVKVNVDRASSDFKRYCEGQEGGVPIEKLRERFLSDESLNTMHPKRHIEKFVNWILFWPFGMLWSLLHDPITWTARTTYELMGTAYRKISDDIVRKSL